MIQRLRNLACSCFVLGLLFVPTFGDPMTFDFTFEHDGDLSAPSFGTVNFDDAVDDQIKITIAVNNSVLGPNADIHEFGFNLNFAMPVSLVPGGDALSLTAGANNNKVQGTNYVFDWIVDFGTGGPGGNTILNPAMFTITGTGLDMNALMNVAVSTKTGKPDAHFAAHVQQTSTNAGSEAIGGTYDVPEPNSLVLISIGLGALGLAALRMKR